MKLSSSLVFLINILSLDKIRCGQDRAIEDLNSQIHCRKNFLQRKQDQLNELEQSIRNLENLQQRYKPDSNHTAQKTFDENLQRLTSMRNAKISLKSELDRLIYEISQKEAEKIRYKNRYHC
ncbi:hypothetical protein EDEG_02163 [Edhazardia aedis USNM 41457]|uniref:Uncharacterized protein n=1 Tax=Edhazardia aedis (strain USNM 41457) TaxID=1003232 RepID=J9DQ89_EDHAE|nr:hypothetical protein EDEG_02163 [Edhazardia aedis USNM 41457]|eukprot:EJW03507.1 hypothetical protein EDEG_02163 [Edhazardia aedis USNM 41457]